MANVEERGSITKDEADVLNSAMEKNIDKILQNFKQQAMEQMEITTSDSPEEIKFKTSFGEQLIQWLTDLFSWVITKVKEIFSRIKEAVKWCFEQAKELFKRLWSFFQ